jgi:hypothetical protein
MHGQQNTKSYLFFPWAKKDMILKPSKTYIPFYMCSCRGQRQGYLSRSYQRRVTANKALHVSRNNETRSCNHCCFVNAIIVTYSECVFVSLFPQSAKRMRRIILSSVASQAVSYFSTSYHKYHDVRKKVIAHKMCVLIFSTTFVWDISHFKRNWARYNHKCVLVVM